MGLRAARSACLLHHPADGLVHQLKYRGWKALADLMGAAMAGVSLPADVAAETGLVVPVPTTALRLRERGYNQAELLARRVAEVSGRRHLPALCRGGGSSSQTALQPVARAANVAGAFRPEEGLDELVGEHLLLVDDVLTTGATVVACAEVLVAAGARCVSVLTFARATGRLRTN